MTRDGYWDANGTCWIPPKQSPKQDPNNKGPINNGGTVVSIRDALERKNTKPVG